MRQLATVSSDKTVKLWNVDGFTLDRTLTGAFTASVISQTCSPYQLGSDKTVKLWNVDGFTLDRTLTGVLLASFLTGVLFLEPWSSGTCKILSQLSFHLLLLQTEAADMEGKAHIILGVQAL